MTKASSPNSKSTKKKTWERRLGDAKYKHRPKLSNWSRDCFGPGLRRHSDFLAAKNLCKGSKGIHHIDCATVKAPEFKEKYEQHYEPCVIDNIPFYEKWLGNIFQPNSTTQIADESNEHSWTIQNLKKRFKNALLKVGEDDDGKRVRVKLKYFLQYMKNNVDDSPLYVFDGSFDDNLLAKSLLEDYKVPSYFTDDLFHLVGEKRRPPYRWFLIGPERSGSSVHIDPLGTSAWNTLLYGRKRWVLFPPGTPRNIAKGKDVIKTGEDDEAINYFVDLLPRIKEKYCNTSSAHTGENIQVIEFIQNAGETVFVPGGWWHGVLNLEDTVAVTQNFCSYANFNRVWRATRGGRKKMSVKWLRQLQEHHPALAKRAKAMNKEDGFIMYNEDDKKKKEKKVKKSSSSS